MGSILVVLTQLIVGTVLAVMRTSGVMIVKSSSYVVSTCKMVVFVVVGATPKVTRLLGVATPVLVVQTSGTTSVVKQGVTVVTIDVVVVAEELMAMFAFTVVKLATL